MMAFDSYNNYAQQAARERLKGESNKDPAATLPLLRLLVPNYVAGSLIGKGGEGMKELQKKFGATIRLSKANDFYPGTDERILLMTGEIDQIIGLNDHIMENFHGDRNKPPRDVTRSEQVKIILTNEVAGLLIGSGGATIKEIQEDAQVKINITNRDASCVPGERILNMSGSIESRKEGCRRVIEKVCPEVTNVANKCIKYTDINAMLLGGGLSSYIQTHQNSLNNTINDMGSYAASNVVRKCNLKTSVEIEVHVPDFVVSSILGKQGVIISELMQYCGAKIQFSAKDDFAPGTTGRILKISGDFDQAKMGYSLVCQKIEESEQELRSQR